MPTTAKPIVQESMGRVVPVTEFDPGNEVMRNVGHQPVPRQRIDRNTAREVFGIIGDNGELYWIEVDRIRTIRTPNNGTVYQPVSQEL